MEKIARLYSLYQKKLHTNNAFDYDDKNDVFIGDGTSDFIVKRIQVWQMFESIKEIRKKNNLS